MITTPITLFFPTLFFKGGSGGSGKKEEEPIDMITHSDPKHKGGGSSSGKKKEEPIDMITHSDPKQQLINQALYTKEGREKLAEAMVEQYRDKNR